LNGVDIGRHSKITETVLIVLGLIAVLQSIAIGILYIRLTKIESPPNPKPDTAQQQLLLNET
jgi:hypothetical protein